MNNCIFCKIVDGSLPSHKIYEDDLFMAFLDICPRVKGHALVIPKKHYRYVYDVPEFGKYWETARDVGFKIQKSLNSKYLTFLTIGNEVLHAHIHILPQATDGLEGFGFDQGLSLDQKDLEKIADGIINLK